MPWSADEHRNWILDRIEPDSYVLDVGAGAGVWADLLKDKVKVIDAVEIFTPYVWRFGLQQKYRKIYHGDFRTLPIPVNYYDYIILGDVLEHFKYEDAMVVWEKSRNIIGPEGRILLSSPIIDFPQGEEEGNIHESHLHQFDMESLRSLSGVLESVEGTIIGSIMAEGTVAPVAEDLTVLITTIPTREDRLDKALVSVENQSLAPKSIKWITDTERVGAPQNRDNGIALVDTKWVALLDDDDYFYPDHLESLYNAAIDNDADIVYSWFDVEGGSDPFPENFGKPWNPEKPIQTTITILAKTDIIRKAGGYTNVHNMSGEELGEFAQGNTAGEDFRLIFNANKLGAKIVHVPKKTWAYVHHSSNTSGLPDRW
jgi:SAM-dependent methyltransferase